jgi:hypothetical protein
MHDSLGRAELDHIFVVVQDEPQARSMMDQAGLRVNYSRVHPGQGTRNICACLDDVFIELLWADGSEISQATKQITLSKRFRGDGYPVGVSWRGSSPFDSSNSSTIPYFAPFLPAGVSIPVVTESLDLSLPFVFQTPGGTPPNERTDGLAGNRQSPELCTLGKCRLILPNAKRVQKLLAPFEKIEVEEGTPSIGFELLGPERLTGKVFNWDLPDYG